MSGDKVHLVLMVLVTLAIIGGFASVVIWYIMPDLRMTLLVDYTLAGNVAGIVAFVNLIALIGIKMKEKWGPLLIIVVVIPNRILGFLFFEVNAGQIVFIVWSVILILFAWFDYKQLPKKEHQTTGGGARRFGVITDHLGLEFVFNYL
jgi:hypothetical protein